MSKKSSKLAVSATAALNLRAELERAVDESKGTGSSGSRIKASEKRSAVWDAQNEGVQQRALKDMLELEREEQSTGEAGARIRAKLEEKARIYDMLSTGQTAGTLDEDTAARIMEESSVDFLSKQYSHLLERKRRREEERGDELVEIIDEFGRSRMVPRSQASQYRDASSDSSDYFSSSDASDGENLMQSTSRSQAVGHYALSSDTAVREEQLRNLQELHRETLAAREAAETNLSLRDRQQQLTDRRWRTILESRARAMRNSRDHDNPQ
ncbi:hypothetical protein FBU59_002793 [Linderina macrospora]|uniref:Uncharacterized protein n=1 Tax=Linderina macrospora TaxID=4868 RepID=A0ACC1JA27_9FUNG|nr:hypothetical protein FBU59_002793 [Linderina macrospora]